MKKYINLIVVFFLLISISLTGCSLEEYIDLKEKPNPFYYTEKLQEEVLSNDINIRILETSFYKEVVLKKENSNLITDFIKALNKNQLINIDNKELPEKSLYKIYIDSKNNEKFVIEVYGEDLIAIFPWDGYYKKDILKVSDLPTSLKPESLCKYILTL